MKFTSLASFYNSDDWKKFRAGIIAERINPENGILYSDYSGNPIVRAYDIIAHHVQPLTMQNVNDFAISLNPENIQIVSFAEHNEIHNRFGGFSTQRKVYVVYGAPCSGKTTWVNQNKGNSDIVLDMDSIWECISGSRYDKPNALKQNAFAIRDLIMDMIKTRAGKWEKAFVIIGGAARSDRERVLAALGAEGVFIQESLETCLNRLLRDDTRTNKQKQEWELYIRKWFDDFVR